VPLRPAASTPPRRRGRIIVVSGPSGVGKGAVTDRLMKALPDLHLSVSVTTRAPRSGEVEGVHYHYVDDATFTGMVERGGFLEWATIYRHRSGTPREAVERQLAAGRDVVLEIDVDGARQVRARSADAYLVFLKPPSLDELERRLRARATETEEQITHRLGSAVEEMAAEDLFDITIVNDDLDTAAAQVVDAVLRLRPGSPGTLP
jgi:guanylate kinase